MTNNSEVIHIKLCHCFINQFVWDRFFVFILKCFFFWKDFRCSPTIIIEETALDSKSFSNILFSISLLLSAVDVEFLKLEDLKLVCIYFLGVKCFIDTIVIGFTVASVSSWQFLFVFKLFGASACDSANSLWHCSKFSSLFTTDVPNSD